MTINQAGESLNLSLSGLKSAVRAGELIASVYAEILFMVHDEDFKSYDEIDWNSCRKEIKGYLYLEPETATKLFDYADMVIRGYKDLSLTDELSILNDNIYCIEDLRFSKESITRYKKLFNLPEFTQKQQHQIEDELLKLAGTSLKKALTKEYFNYWKEFNKKPSFQIIKNRLKKNLVAYAFIKEINDVFITWEKDETEITTKIKTLQNFLPKLNKKLPHFIAESKNINPAYNPD